MTYGMLSNLWDDIPDTQQNDSNSFGCCGMNQPAIPNEPTFCDSTSTIQDVFNGFKTTPVLYNMDGYISPYSSNWGSASGILSQLEEQTRLPQPEQKIDPNRIFTPELNGLKNLAADQQKIVKVFEKRLFESLNERGKMGLTEEDIEALSALTTARTGVANIMKEKVAIKKNITDIRLKQQQNLANNNGGNGSMSDGLKPGDTMSTGRNMLDNIFSSTLMSSSTIRPVAINTNESVNTQYNVDTSIPQPGEVTTVTPSNTTDAPVAVNNNVINGSYSSDSNDLNKMIDEITPEPAPSIMHESRKPTEYAVMDSKTEAHLEAYDSNNERIHGYFDGDDTRSITIVEYDRDSNIITDELEKKYPVYEQSNVIDIVIPE